MTARVDALFSAPAAKIATLAIVRPQLHAELLSRIRDFIITCDLPPGSKVPEKELCERFGVSRTPLRETLKVLGL
jgi:DNA-binding GntR family transcriptional regulator